MTDHTNPAMPTPAEIEQYETLVNFLQGNLPPDQEDVIRNRLLTDEAYKEFAWPLVLLWNVPDERLFPPRPKGELEDHWDAFTKKARFAHQVRKARRRRWGIFLMIAFVAATLLLLNRARVSDAWDNAVHYSVLPDSGHEMALQGGARVQLTRGSILRVRSTAGSRVTAKLDGSATFTALPDSNQYVANMPLVVRTRGAFVSSTRGHFVVRTSGDTTSIEALPSAKPAFIAGLVPLPEIVNVFDPAGSGSPLELRQGEVARTIRGQRAEKMHTALSVVRSVDTTTGRRRLAQILGVETVVDSGREMTLRDGTRLTLRKGSTLDALQEQFGTYRATLRGSARFRIGAGSPTFPERHGVIISTPGGSVSPFGSIDMFVRTDGKNTTVELLSGTIVLKNGRTEPGFVTLIPSGDQPPNEIVRLLPGEKATIYPHARRIPVRQFKPDPTRKP